METPHAGCTPGCTTNAKTANDTTIEALAAQLGALSPADRAKLTVLLAGPTPKGA